MPYGNGGDFILELHNCRTWRSVDDLIQSLETLVDEFDFIVLEHKDLSPLSIDNSKQFLREYCYSRYKTGTRSWDQNYYFSQADGSLHLDIECPFLPKSSPPVFDRIMMISSIYGQEYNQISFQMELGKRYASPEKINKYQGALMNLYTRMSLFLDPILSPDYMNIKEFDFTFEEFVKGIDVVQKKIKFIYWANYFGSGFLSGSEQDVFINAPVGVTKSSNSGLWYYLNEDFTALTDDEMLTAEAKATEYFSSYFDLTRTQWRFVTP